MEPTIRQINSLYGISIIFVIACIGVWAEIMPLPLTSKISPTELPALFATLILVSAFMERAIEVFLSAMRSAGADELDSKIQQVEGKLKESYSQESKGKVESTEDIETYNSLKGQLESKLLLRTQYRGRSRQISQWIGLVLGTLIAMIGVRLVGSLVATEEMNSHGKMIFVMVDIIVTGAVLAGGSDAINKVTKLYSTFMDSTNKKARV